MDEVECVGTETSLGMCRFQGWSNTDCDHSEDAGVICQDSTFQNMGLRLICGVVV